MIRRFGLSVAGGVIWGWISMSVNSVSGAFMFEGSFMQNVVMFAFAGGVFGAVAGGLLCALEEKIPFKSLMLKAVVVSTAAWVVLRAGGAALSRMEPSRYNIVTPQTVQGFFLAVALGIILGFFLKDRPSSFQKA